MVHRWPVFDLAVLWDFEDNFIWGNRYSFWLTIATNSRVFKYGFVSITANFTQKKISKKKWQKLQKWHEYKYVGKPSKTWSGRKPLKPSNELTSVGPLARCCQKFFILPASPLPTSKSLIIFCLQETRSEPGDQDWFKILLWRLYLASYSVCLYYFQGQGNWAGSLSSCEPWSADLWSGDALLLGFLESVMKWHGQWFPSFMV